MAANDEVLKLQTEMTWVGARLRGFNIGVPLSLMVSEAVTALVSLTELLEQAWELQKKQGEPAFSGTREQRRALVGDSKVITPLDVDVALAQEGDVWARDQDMAWSIEHLERSAKALQELVRIALEEKERGG